MGAAEAGSDRGSDRASAWGRVPRWLRRTIFWVVAVVLGSRLLSVGLIPTVTTDSLTYLKYSNDLTGNGFVLLGYRQFGYPLFLALVDLLGRGFGIEPLILTVAIQRLLLMVGIAYAAWLWRWWSLVLIFVLTTPGLVAYTDFILTEGLAIPLALIYACALCHWRVVHRDPDRVIPWRFLGRYGRQPYASFLPIALASVLFLALVAIRMTLLPLGLPLLYAYYVGARQREARWRIGVVAIATLGLVVVMAGAMSLENRREFSDFFPVSGGARPEFWGAWQLVFVDHPETQALPEMQRYYGNGNSYAYVTRVRARFSTYPEQREAFGKAIDAMLQAAGLSKGSEQVRSFLFAMLGGRHDDVGSRVNRILNANTRNLDAVIQSNSKFDSPGGQIAFADTYNRGQMIEPVMLGALVPRPFPVPIRYVLALFGPFSLATIVGALVFRVRSPGLAVASLAGALVSFGLVGYLLLDNLRFVIVTMVFQGTAATGVLADTTTNAVRWVRSLMPRSAG